MAKWFDTILGGHALNKIDLAILRGRAEREQKPPEPHLDADDFEDEDFEDEDSANETETDDLQELDDDDDQLW